MSQQSNQNLQDSKRVASKGAKAAKTGVKGGVKAGKAAAKGAEKALALIPPEALLVIAGVILALVLLLAIVEGLNSVQMDNNEYRTAVKEEAKNIPADDTEAYEANYNLGLAIKQTLELSDVIHEAKQKEKEEIAAKYPGKKVVCESDQAPVFINENYPEYMPSFTSSGGGGPLAAVEWAKARAEESKQGKWYYVYYGSSGNGPNGVKCSTVCPVCNPKKGSKGWQCIGFVTAAMYHGGGIPSNIKSKTPCSLSGLGDGGDGKGQGTLDGSTPDEVFEKWKKRNGNDWEMVSTKSLKSGYLRADQLKTGDVLICYNSSGNSYHMMLYAGGGMVVDSSRGNTKYNGEKGGILLKSYKTRYGARVAMRYTGSATSSTGTTLSGKSSGAQQVIDGACAWAVAIANDNSFHYGKKPHSQHNGCYFCGTNTLKGGRAKKGVLDYKKTYCCNPFVHAAYAHGGGDPTMLKICKKGSSYDFSTKGSNTYHNSKLFENLGKVKVKNLQKGDVLCTNNHVMLYLGDGKIAHATGGDDNKRNSRKWNRSIRVDKVRESSYHRVYRYIGRGGGEMESPGGSGAGTTSGTTFTKQDKFTILDEITPSTGTRYSIGCVGGSNCAQSFAYTGDGFAVSFVTASHAPSHVKTYDKKGNGKESVRADAISHANAASMTPDGKYMVAGTMNPSSKTGHVFGVTGGLKKEGTKSLPATASSMAYDRETGKYILATSGSFKVYDNNLTHREASHSRNAHRVSFCQDIGAANGYIFACQTIVKGRENYGKNYVDVYNEVSGDYCGSYYIKYGELESVDVVDGELVLLVHILGRVNYIHYTGINVGSMQGGGISSYTTKHDLDVLASYSVSLSNTGLFKGEEKKNGENETWIDKLASGDVGTNNYTDLKGNKLKLYWFGEKRGRVNYKSDLKKKLGEGWFRKKKVYFYEVIEGQEALDAIKEDSVDQNAASAGSSGSDEIVYLRERPISDILSDMDMEPDETYSGSGRESMFDATNLEAAIGMSDNTENMLYTGYMRINLNGASSLADLGSGDFGLPLEKGSYTITSHVGKRTAPTAGASTNHPGVDMAAPIGTPVYASLSGTVTVARKVDRGGYGLYVQIKSGDYEIIYAHLSKVLVNDGDVITKGQNIGQVGSTGTSTGPHLHFEVHKNGKVVDPESFMKL